MGFGYILAWIFRLFELLFGRTIPSLDLPTCQIKWTPNVLAPVFYGIRDYSISDGAPTPCRVFYPSLDGAVWDAPILEGCGRYPLILFAHGHCSEVEHYKKWYMLPAQLARSGYVVAVPELPEISSGIHPSGADTDLQRLADILTWIRNGWEYGRVILPSPATGIIGHSYGALLAARFAASNPIAAYASLSGVWADWPGGPEPIRDLTIPMFFAWGTGQEVVEVYAQHVDRIWGALHTPKHKAIFGGAEHWDYLSARTTTCERTRGACRHVGVLSSDLVSIFFGKYLPPEYWPGLGSRIPYSLIPPATNLTNEQRFYSGGHLTGMSLIEGSEVCRVTLAWETTGGGTGSVMLPLNR